jgi:predicted ABC-type exoprotein transport system permease subunit
MAQRKKTNPKKNEAYDDAFNLFAIIALYPVDKAARIKSYPVSITLVLLIAVIWTVPVFFVGAVISSMVCVISLLNKLITNKIYGGN